MGRDWLFWLVAADCFWGVGDGGGRGVLLGWSAYPAVEGVALGCGGAGQCGEVGEDVGEEFWVVSVQLFLLYSAVSGLGEFFGGGGSQGVA